MRIHSAAVTQSQCWLERRGRGRGNCEVEEVRGRKKGWTPKRKGDKKEESERERERET